MTKFMILRILFFFCLPRWGFSFTTSPSFVRVRSIQGQRRMHNHHPHHEEAEQKQAAPGISSQELRQMNEARQRRQGEDQASQNNNNIASPPKSRFVTGDALQKLRQEVLTLSEERRTLLETGQDPDRVTALEQAIWQAQQVDAEFVYDQSKRLAEAAEAAGVLPAAAEHRREAARARQALPQFNLDGLWVGKYGEHGFEMINVTYAGDVLIAYKVTGDANVPKGEVSFTVDLGVYRDSSSSPLLEPIELASDAAVQWGSKYLPRFSGQGQVARQGFVNPKWMEGQLILVNQYFSFAWLPIGHQVFFGRPSAELTLKLLRESRSKNYSDQAARDYILRCWEETEYIQDDMDVTDGIFKSHEQTYYYHQDGCFE